jgi:N-acetylglucosamine repressor
MYYNIIDLAILNLNSVIRYRLCDPAKRFTTYEELIDLMAEQILEAMRLYDIPREKFYSVSISADGIVDAKNGIVRYPMHHDWPRDMHLLRDLRDKLVLKPEALFLDSPIAFMGYAELLSSDSADLDKILCLFAGNAASGCVISNREILHGANGFIGEFGHIDPYSDVKCSCGGYGCFETLVSVSRLLDTAREASGNGSLSLADFFDDYKKSEPYAVKELDRIIRVFSIMIHNLILTHDPDKVIIQGPYSSAGESFIRGIKEQINDLPFYKVKRDIDIEFASISAVEAIHVGAAYHSFNNFLREFKVP